MFGSGILAAVCTGSDAVLARKMILPVKYGITAVFCGVGQLEERSETHSDDGKLRST